MYQCIFDDGLSLHEIKSYLIFSEDSFLLSMIDWLCRTELELNSRVWSAWKERKCEGIYICCFDFFGLLRFERFLKVISCLGVGVIFSKIHLLVPPQNRLTQNIRGNPNAFGPTSGLLEYVLAVVSYHLFSLTHTFGVWQLAPYCICKYEVCMALFIFALMENLFEQLSGISKACNYNHSATLFVYCEAEKQLTNHA